MKQTILFLRNGNLFATREEAIEGLNSVMHKAGQPVVALYGVIGSVELVMAVGTEDGKYKILQESIDNLICAVDADGELDEVPEDVCVKYVSQSLTEEQKNQVRENLGIPSMEYVLSLFEQLKQMIENNNASDAIAVLDSAILDLHKLQ